MQFLAPYNLFPEDRFEIHLHPDHLADLMRSGLTENTIRAAGVYSLAPGFINRFFSVRGVRDNLPKINSALCFPYQGRAFARIKLFPALGKWKYAQPPGSSARLYVPFPVKTDTLYVCEGEKKTLAAHQAGLNAVGIGGIWNWLTNGEPIKDLALIDWDGREVVIVPDSDVWDRSDLLRAIYALGRELRQWGTLVSVAEIPQDGPEKVGLDDYLLVSGDVGELELLTLDQRVFRSCQFWYGGWMTKRALAA